jgi:hypothetical protein
LCICYMIFGLYITFMLILHCFPWPSFLFSSFVLPFLKFSCVHTPCVNTSSSISCVVWRWSLPLNSTYVGKLYWPFFYHNVNYIYTTYHKRITMTTQIPSPYCHCWKLCIKCNISPIKNKFETSWPNPNNKFIKLYN